MNNLNLQLKPSNLKVNQYLHLSNATGAHATAATTTAFDSFTSYSIEITIKRSVFSSTRPANWVPFSCVYTSGGDMNGIYVLAIGNTWYWFVGDGNGLYNLHLQSLTSLQPKFRSQKTGQYMTVVFTADATTATNNLKTYTMSSGSPNSTDDRFSTATTSAAYTNWGTLGTNSHVVIGGKIDGSTALSFNTTLSGIGVVRVQMWDSALSEANAKKIGGFKAGQTSTKFKLQDYSAGSYPRPIHSWTPQLYIDNNPKVPATHLLDQGSATALNLELKGTMKAIYG